MMHRSNSFAIQTESCIISHPCIIGKSNQIEEVAMKGTLICSRCERRMVDKTCMCGSTTCYLRVQHEGHSLKRRKDAEGRPFNLESGIAALDELNRKAQIYSEPSERMPVELRFDVQIAKWLEEKEIEIVIGEKSIGYLRLLQGYTKNWYIPFFSAMNIQEINFEMLTRFKQGLGSVKIKTRRHLLCSLASFFRWLLARNLVCAMPVFPKTTGDDSIPRKALNQEQQERALGRIPDKLRDIFAFGVETGLRTGELWKNIGDALDILTFGPSGVILSQCRERPVSLQFASHHVI